MKMKHEEVDFFQNIMHHLKAYISGLLKRKRHLESMTSHGNHILHILKSAKFWILTTIGKGKVRVVKNVLEKT